MKKIVLILLLISVLLSSLAACRNDSSGDNKPNEDPSKNHETVKEGIEFEKKDGVTVDVGKKVALTVKNLETGKKVTNLFWSSDNEEIVTVNNGEITGVSQGTATVTATTFDKKHSATCTVTVILRLTGVSINYEYYDLEIGDTVQLEASPVPESFIGATYEWISDQPEIASVDENGLVTARALGNTTVMVSAKPGEDKWAMCIIKVGKYADSLTLSDSEITINRDVSHELRLTMLPSDATSRPFWSSSDESVAIVNSGGVITAKACGEAIITVKTTNGLEASCKVTVISALNGFKFEEEEFTVAKGSVVEPGIIYLPADATNKTLIWKSDNRSVVSIIDGVPVAVGNGMATLTATSDEGGYVQTCIVYVNNPLTSITFEQETDPETGKVLPFEIQCTDTAKLPVVITPADADELSLLVWTSSNAAVITVSSDGTVTAHSIGEATVTVTSPNGISASINVKVTKKIYPLKDFLTASDKYYMNANDLIKIKFIYVPAEAEIDTVIGEVVSSDPSVAQWNAEQSMIVAHSLGTCEITFNALSIDGAQFTYTVTVYVVENGTSFDEEYKSDTHALRDAYALEIKELKDRLAELKSKKSELEADIAELEQLILAGGGNNNGENGVDSNGALLEQYREELLKLEEEIKKAEADIKACEEKYAQAEAGLASKYSCVKENITYDPTKDLYPDHADTEFVKVSDYIDGIIIDLKYAGEDNETGEKIYNFSDAYLRYGTVKKLKNVVEALAADGLEYKLVIWDAYRPKTAQDRIWALTGVTDGYYDDNCRGSAVYVSLVDMNGNPIEMPCGYGESGSLADRDYSDVSAQAKTNADTLAAYMIVNGFSMGEQWWHFADNDSYDMENEFLSDKVVALKKATVSVNVVDEAPVGNTEDYVHFTDETAWNRE